MTYATSHQTWGHRITEDPYRSLAKSRASKPLHEVVQTVRNTQRGPEVFPAWLFDFENLGFESPLEGRREDAYKAFIKDVSFLTQSRDPYTAGHQLKVSDIAEGIARELGLPAETIEGIRVAGMVHDMGKLSVPAEIVTKPGALTSFEFSIIKEHPARAFEVLKEIDFPWPVAEMVLQHHERLDGSGYPGGLEGDEIRLEARVLAVADVVGAISSHRPYRRDLGLEAALREIDKKKGLLYDPEVTRACRRSMRGRSVFVARSA
ncbi:MAG: HD-GYP domain-containing protein [Desulfobacterota bacterium]|nr:HD-GYP domain-containing protein [Thermodesulfobacteriota bacterium]